jgi:transcription elongation factor Elf1
MTADTSPTYDCPKCNGIRTVIDAGDAQYVYWCKQCRAFFMEFQLKTQSPAKSADD